MKVSDVMTTTVVTIQPDTPVREIAGLMVEKRISGIPVVDGDAHVVGMVSEGDLIRRREIGTDVRRRGWLSLLTSPERDARDFIKTHGLNAKDVLSKPVHTVKADADLADAARLMEKNRIKRLPVVTDGKLVGLITRADLLRCLASQQSMSPAPPPASDRSIRDQLLKTIGRETWAASAVVNVIVTEGVVHLWGVVDNREQREALIVAAREIAGVKEVEDHLGVDLPT
jgi:CBS domain-containing protein